MLYYRTKLGGLTGGVEFIVKSDQEHVDLHGIALEFYEMYYSSMKEVTEKLIAILPESSEIEVIIDSWWRVNHMISVRVTCRAIDGRKKFNEGQVSLELLTRTGVHEWVRFLKDVLTRLYFHGQPY